jgi:DNA-binding MarR family transcriptional regulator
VFFLSLSATQDPHRNCGYANIIDVYTSKKETLKSPSSKHAPSSSPCACTTVKKLSRVLGRVYDARLAPSGINVTQFAVMRCISRHNGEPLARVAEELEMDRTSLYRAIAPMQRDGWITLAAGTDGRSRSALVTRKGVQVIAKAGGEWDQIQNHLIGAFGKEEWRALVKALARLSQCAGTISEN